MVSKRNCIAGHKSNTLCNSSTQWCGLTPYGVCKVVCFNCIANCTQKPEMNEARTIIGEKILLQDAFRYIFDL